MNIPPDFQRDVLAGRQPDIQANVDATRMSQAFTGNSYIQNIISGEVNSFVARYRDNSEPPGVGNAYALLISIWNLPALAR